MNQTKILVTGGAGNVGGSLVRKLVQNPNNFVVVADNLVTGNKSKLPSSDYTNWKFIKADINQFREIAAIMLSYQFDYVFHYAALVGVKRTLDNPMLVLQDIEGIKNILELCKNTGVKRVFYSSSSEVYGEPVEFPQNEDTTPLNSKLNYAVVKNLGEVYLKTYKKDHDLDFTIFRFFNTYGPQQSTDFVVPKFIQLALNNKDITIYGAGSQTRTFCYIDDNIDTVVKILEENHCINDVINIGNDIEYSILELAEMVIRITKSKSSIKFLPPLKEGDMTRRKPDNSKMKNILKRELITIEQGIENVLGKGNLSTEYRLDLIEG